MKAPNHMRRASGVLMHISSLPGDFGIGSFGKEAKAFAKTLADAGFTWWQVLPFCPTDEFYSPYKSVSCFAGNPYFIDLPTLAEEGLITPAELEAAREKTPYACEFARLEAERLPLLLTAASRVKNPAPIHTFLDAHPQIKRACEFLALREANEHRLWTEWTITRADPADVFAWGFIEYTFYRQWADVKRYANDLGVKIIGDIPIYVSLDSADVWANRELFDLDEDFAPRNVAGVPPDYFSADGQLWGNPLYRWDRMKQDNYAWWSERLETMLTLFDGVRIDHFRALESYWSVPADAETAREGKWVKGPGKPFIRRLREVAGDKLIIAEDLGDITPAVNELISYSGFPGMRVMQFAFLGDPASPHLPHNYAQNTVAYTGTHDNNTLLGYVWEQSDDNRRRLLAYCQYTDKNWDACYGNIIRTVLASHAFLTIFPIQDLLRHGSDCRMNTPGRAIGNWAYRITREQMRAIPVQALRADNSMYGRI